MTEIAKLKRDLKEAQDLASETAKKLRDAEYKAKEAELEPLKLLAIKAHDLLCQYNHCDGCSWLYEIVKGKHTWDGNYSAHRRWLEHIGRLVNPGEYDRTKPLSVETINELLDWVAQVKKKTPDAIWIITHNLIPR